MLSRDLQNIVSRVGVALAGGETYGRVELDRLARELRFITEDAQRLERQAHVESTTLDALFDGLQASVADAQALLRRAKRQRSPIQSAAASAAQSA